MIRFCGEWYVPSHGYEKANSKMLNVCESLVQSQGLVCDPSCLKKINGLLSLARG